MKIIDRYIFKKLIPMFLFLLLTVIFITCLSDYLFNYRIAEADLSYGQIFFYYMLSSVLIIKLTLSSIAFIATILVVLRLSSNCEIVAFLSNGITYKRFLKPFILFSLLLLKVMLICEGWLFPLMDDMRYEFEREYFGRRQARYGYDIHVKLDDNSFLYIKNYNHKNQKGYDVYIDEIKDNRLVSRLSANTMSFKDGKWIFRNCKKRTYDGHNHTMTTEKEIILDNISLTPDDLIFDKSFYKKLTTGKLNDYVSRLQQRGIDCGKQKIEQLSRLQRPFLIFVIMILAVLFSSNRSRAGTSKQLLAGFILAGGFIFGSILLEGFAAYGGKNILLCLFGPIVICAIVDVMLYKYVQK